MTLNLRTGSLAACVVALMGWSAGGQVPLALSQGQRIQPKNSRLKSITVLQANGARPRFSPDGKVLVFDRRNADEYFDVYLSDIQGNVLRKITEGNPGITQRNNGNARFDPSGKFIVFVSEAPRHYLDDRPRMGDSGIGLYSNFWATDLQGSHFWQLTHEPVKQTLTDGVPNFAESNPLFSRDGHTFLWTQRYADRGHFFGWWRIMAADFVVSDGQPSLRNQRVLITPQKGNYITAMAFLDNDHLLVSGNLDGQHEYGMDQYVYDLRSGHFVNLTNTPLIWDEDSCLAPNGDIVWMSNQDSRIKFDFSDRHGVTQPIEREYYAMTSSGQDKQRLTYFNEPGTPEYVGIRTLVAACDISPDGRYLAGTLSIDFGTATRRERGELKAILMEFAQPLAGTQH